MTHGTRRDVRISSHCTNGTCVGVAAAPGGVEVIDSKNPQAVGLLISTAAWSAFVAAAKAGEFDTLAE